MLDFLPEVVIAAVAGTVGWFGKRFWTNAADREEAEDLSIFVGLLERLDAQGLSLDEARALRNRFRQGKEPISPAIAAAISRPRDDQMEIPDDIVGSSLTTLEIGKDMRTRLDDLELQLEDALAELVEGSTPARSAALKNSQKAWEEFRAYDAEFVSLLWEGGSGAPLLSLSRQIELTESRINEVRLAKAEENQL